MNNTLFLLHDSMHKRGLCYGSVSVCLSRSCILSRWLKISSNFFPPCSYIILVFDPAADTQFQGEPVQWAAKYKGVGKFCDFQLKLPSVLETVGDRPMDATER